MRGHSTTMDQCSTRIEKEECLDGVKQLGNESRLGSTRVEPTETKQSNKNRRPNEPARLNKQERNDRTATDSERASKQSTRTM